MSLVDRMRLGIGKVDKENEFCDTYFVYIDQISDQYSTELFAENVLKSSVSDLKTVEKIIDEHIVWKKTGMKPLPKRGKHVK